VWGTGQVVGPFEELEELPELLDFGEGGDGFEAFRVAFVLDCVALLQPEGELAWQFEVAHQLL